MLLRILILLSLIFSCNAYSDITKYFNSINHSRKALYEFFAKMPKGGELHYHLSGGATPELMLNLASHHHYCLNPKNFILTEMASNCDGIDSYGLKNNTKMYEAALRAWSMKDFSPSEESAHDHFFNTFFKFNPIVVHHSPDLLIDVIKRAERQHEKYLEVMILPDDNKASAWNTLIQKVPSFATKQKILLSNAEFLKNIQMTKQNAHELLTDMRKKLGCDDNSMRYMPRNVGVERQCKITVKFQYIILREQRVNHFFAQALNAFASASNSSEIAGVNIVQAENGPLSLKNFTIQMQILRFLHRIYPQVHIALHSGEFSPSLIKQHKIKSEDMKFHIHDAIFVGQAQRIGHGTDLRHESDFKETAEYMAENHIPVEISFTSNYSTLGLSPKNHPISTYLKHHVPIVISTDDEGLLRTNLTKQYVIAAKDFGFDYSTLKTINRNTLTYNFLSGKSIWQDPENGIMVKECQSLTTPSCLNFINHSAKAKLQWELERELNRFEALYAGSIKS